MGCTSLLFRGLWYSLLQPLITFLFVIPAHGLAIWIKGISIQKKASGGKQVYGNPALKIGPWQPSSKPPPGLHTMRNAHHGLNLTSHQYSAYWVSGRKAVPGIRNNTCIKSSISMQHDDISGAGQAALLCASAICMMQLAHVKLPAGYARIGARKCMQAWGEAVAVSMSSNGANTAD